MIKELTNEINKIHTLKLNFWGLGEHIINIEKIKREIGEGFDLKYITVDYNGNIYFSNYRPFIGKSEQRWEYKNNGLDGNYKFYYENIYNLFPILNDIFDTNKGITIWKEMILEVEKQKGH